MATARPALPAEPVGRRTSPSSAPTPTTFCRQTPRGDAQPIWNWQRGPRVFFLHLQRLTNLQSGWRTFEPMPKFSLLRPGPYTLRKNPNEGRLQLQPCPKLDHKNKKRDGFLAPECRSSLSVSSFFRSFFLPCSPPAWTVTTVARRGECRVRRRFYL